MFCGAQTEYSDLLAPTLCGEQAVILWGTGDQLIPLCLIHYDLALRLTADVADVVERRVETVRPGDRFL